jgi:hypothetical protein
MTVFLLARKPIGPAEGSAVLSTRVA